MNNYTI